ncbi:hypothetical protein B9Z19DRAFT_1067439 [Tuber borchii]|uniref:Uncharacterized protein n=1 Tax=Tuber borchii TaxID=42251 RepID=A0A2T6ZIT5_TUBBO|nr:hypothetical protein B9Z19DRAFT_1067439 [Tuber borchii]
MKYSVSAIVLDFFAAFNAAASTPDDKPDPGQVTIMGVACAVTILFDDYEVSIGPGSKFADNVKNATSTSRANYTGSTYLEPGVTVKQVSSYWFAGFISDKLTFQSS